MPCCPTCGQAFPSDFWRFDIESATLLVDGLSLHLSPRKAAIMGLLLKNIGKPVHRDRLIMAMYDGREEPEDAQSNLEVQLCGLRKILNGSRLRVSRVFGFGYAITLKAAEGGR